MAVVQYRVRKAAADDFGKANALLWLAQYALFQSGPLAHPPVHVGAFVKTRPGLSRPDLQFHVVPWGAFSPNTDETSEPDKGTFLNFFPSLIYPESRGEIRLESSDPLAAPAIEPRYFADSKDMDLLVAGVKLSREIARAGALARECIGEVRPGPDAKTDDEIRADIRARVNTIFHPVGTCKMGTDDQAVVDPQLRVHGIERLRVVDGSIMPTIIGGNTHAPIVMIAERASDLIRRKVVASSARTKRVLEPA
jgi:choline dehydrogenase